VAGMVRGYINKDENELLGRRRGWVENITSAAPIAGADWPER